MEPHEIKFDPQCNASDQKLEPPCADEGQPVVDALIQKILDVGLNDRRLERLASRF